MLAMTQVPRQQPPDHDVGAHAIDLVGNVKGIHDLLAEFVRQALNFFHHAGDAFGERRMRWIGHQFIVLMKSMPANPSSRTMIAVCFGESPTLGLMMVPRIGR